MTERMEKLAAHARELARAFKVLLIERAEIPMEEAMSGQDRISGHRFVMTHTIETEFGYAIALHELGHANDPIGQVSTYVLKERGPGAVSADLKLEEELAAWHWARHYALDWSAEMDAAERIGMETYHQNKQIEESMPDYMRPIYRERRHQIVMERFKANTRRV